MCPSAPPQCLSPLLSFCVLCCTGTSIYQCQSPVLKLNRLAHIDYHWIKNKAWCKFQIKVDNGIISVNHDLLMNVLILPSAPLVRGYMRAKRGKTFCCQWHFLTFCISFINTLQTKSVKICEGDYTGRKKKWNFDIYICVWNMEKIYSVKYQEILSSVKNANQGIKSSMLK